MPAAGLHEAANPVGSPDAAIEVLVDELRATMAANSGMGLAAPQIGVQLDVAVVRVGSGEIVLIDPIVERQRGRQAGWEGCLSIPDRVAWVIRPAEVTVATLDLRGRRHLVQARALLARAVIHEIDHLRGRLYADALAPDELVDTVKHPTPPRPGR